MTRKNSGLLSVKNGDKTATFRVPTKPAREAVERDNEFGPRSALIEEGFYIVTCRSAAYLTERKTKEGTTKFKTPMIEVNWEAFEKDGITSLGVFRDSHSLPIQVEDDTDVSKGEKFWSLMGRSFAEAAGKLDEYLATDEVPRSPANMETKTGFAKVRVTKGANGKLYSGIHFFCGKEECMRSYGPAVGTATVTPKTGPKELVGDENDGRMNGEVDGEQAPPFDDADVPF
jgi:hypothetical protein